VIIIKSRAVNKALFRVFYKRAYKFININKEDVGLAQPSAIQASLYRLHFGNPEISLTGFYFHHFYLIIAWNAKT
jgi:hypothetical protein